VSAQYWKCGGSVLEIDVLQTKWFSTGLVLAQNGKCGGSAQEKWWLSTEDLVAQYWRSGGSVLNVMAQYLDVVVQC
jgi:hypothetical protein